MCVVGELQRQCHEQLDVRADACHARLAVGKQRPQERCVGRADADGARAANTTPAKFKQMRERLVTFSSSGSQWSSSEKALLNGRKAEIQNAVKTP